MQSRRDVCCTLLLQLSESRMTAIDITGGGPRVWRGTGRVAAIAFRNEHQNEQTHAKDRPRT